MKIEEIERILKKYIKSGITKSSHKQHTTIEIYLFLCVFKYLNLDRIFEFFQQIKLLILKKSDTK